jgi:DNA-binding response OmpR family regulator
MSRILVVDDEPAILRGVADNLRRELHDVWTAADGETAYRLITEKTPDLVVLDLMLPKLSGYELCRRMRSDGLPTLILMLTARGEETDRVVGLDMGADDYLTKPFSVRELLARVRALLRRTQSAPRARDDQLVVGDITVDFRRYEARKAGTPFDMTRREFQILQALASRPGEVVTRDELLNQVWGLDASPTTRTIDNHIAGLRAKLEADPDEPRRILTVRGVGYKWLPDE